MSYVETCCPPDEISYSHDEPIGRRKRGYILTTNQSDVGSAGSAGIFSRRTNRPVDSRRSAVSRQSVSTLSTVIETVSGYDRQSGLVVVSHSPYYKSPFRTYVGYVGRLEGRRWTNSGDSRRRSKPTCRVVLPHARA
eukprot:9492844-Pyramimonas_sp.AAC.1